MKQLSITPLFLLILASFTSTAQTFKGEQDIAISAGIMPAKYDDFSIDQYGDGNTRTATSGDLFMSYKYFLDNRFAIGATAGIQTSNGQIYYYGGVLEDNYKIINKTIAAEMTIVYANKRNFQLYTLIGYGITITSLLANNQVNNGYSAWSSLIVSQDFTPNTGTYIDYQFDPICLRIGKKIAGFLELGYGYKGILNTGIQYRFGKKHPPAVK